MMTNSLNKQKKRFILLILPLILLQPQEVAVGITGAQKYYIHSEKAFTGE